MAKTQQPTLVDLLAKASASDLEDIDKQIAEVQAELDEATKRIGGQLDSLKVIRKVLDVKINGKPARAPKGSKKAAKAAAAQAGGKVDSPMLKQIMDVLKSSGACKTMTIARKLGGEHLEHNVRMLVGQNKDKFIRNDDGTWELIA